MDITIKIATPEDTLGIVNVRRTTWLDTYPNEKAGISTQDIEEKINHKTIDEEKEQVLKRFLDPNIKIYVAKIVNQVIGYVVGAKEKINNRIWALYVLPEYQGRGIGSELIGKALDFLGKEKDIVFEVVAYNTKAISFYKKFGFVENGIGNNPVGKLPGGKVMPEIAMIKRFSTV